jgi:hypothetical protein
MVRLHDFRPLPASRQSLLSLVGIWPDRWFAGLQHRRVVIIPPIMFIPSTQFSRAGTSPYAPPAICGQQAWPRSQYGSRPKGFLASSRRASDIPTASAAPSTPPFPHGELRGTARKKARLATGRCVGPAPQRAGPGARRENGVAPGLWPLVGSRCQGLSSKAPYQGGSRLCRL